MMRKLNLRPSPEDLRDYKFKTASFKTVAELPRRVDLRNEFMPPMWDQGYLGSCQSFAALGLYEYLFMRQHMRPGVPLSKLYLYYYARDQQEWTQEDNGAYLRDVCKVLYHRGICPDVEWPYNQTKVYDHPSRPADATAFAFRISEYNRILNFTDAKVSLAEGYPVKFGMQIYSSFMSGHNGYIPIPDITREAYEGAHAMLIVGYDEDKQHMIVRNSWGAEWGDGGYCYIPYSLFAWPNVFEYWTFRVDPRNDY